MKNLFALTLLAATALAQAEPLSAVDMELGNFATKTSTVSRQQVLQELQAARAKGELQFGDKDVVVTTAKTTSEKTRTQVVQELQVARKSGELDRIQRVGY